MKNMEIEVKFQISDADLVRDRIVELGGISKGRYFETNIRFEDQDKTLVRNKALLRLRRDRTSTLTFKSKPADADSEFKVFREIEVEVGDFDNMALILNALGYHPEQIYEKWRETFVYKDTVLCLDVLPFGMFLEIEGDKEAIKSVAREIGLAWEKRIIDGYLALFETLCRKHRLNFQDLTFENFKNLKVTF